MKQNVLLCGYKDPPWGDLLLFRSTVYVYAGVQKFVPPPSVYLNKMHPNFTK